ncbi:RING/U-box superfamily protein [Raphanus sativus]|uniref:RING-type E3 ubiquitin transferase n=1 Tax=Raphanus sativus TaxID=3726 RepID=A0A6J0M3A1_RAPSA|nr:E3 ubiquitin-protein ligase SIRP1 [Raphanus sativus]KAJ4917990.1 RING/U-box superfamily protein [Raphanus sativus]
MENRDEEEEENNAYRPMDTVLAPIFIQMMKNSARNGTTTDMDSQLQEILRRRGRRPVSIDQLLQGIRTGLTLAPAAAAADAGRERGRVIVTNPYNQIVAVPSSAVSDALPPAVAGSLSEYFIGPEFEAMLERLTETDPSRYGTPPARRDAVEALASVIIQEPGLQCSVCLDDFEVGTLGKQMPCNHRFHPHCLLPWLELHSSCPVCRYQLPETNGVSGGGGSSSSSSSSSSTSSSQGYENSHGNRDDDDGDRSMLDAMEA